MLTTPERATGRKKLPRGFRKQRQPFLDFLYWQTYLVYMIIPKLKSCRGCWSTWTRTQAHPKKEGARVPPAGLQGIARRFAAQEWPREGTCHGRVGQSQGQAGFTPRADDLPCARSRRERSPARLLQPVAPTHHRPGRCRERPATTTAGRSSRPGATPRLLHPRRHPRACPPERRARSRPPRDRTLDSEGRAR